MWPVVGGGLLLVLLVIAAVIVLLGERGTDAAASPSQSASPTASGDSTPSATEGTSASPSASASPTAGAFAADDIVFLIVDRLTLRRQPGLDGEAMWVLPEGEPAFVIDGPMEVGGLPWYQLSGLGVPYGSGCVTPEPGGLLECPAWLGWVAGAGEDGTPYLAYMSDLPPCDQSVPDVVSLSQLPYTMRLVCYDREEITLRAWWPLEPGPTSGGSCAAAGTDVAWLACQSTNPNGLAANPDEPAGRWYVSIDPASGISMPPRGQWVEVVGHFDDPAADGCAQVAELADSDPGAEVFNCRLQFVLNSVTPAPAQ